MTLETLESIQELIKIEEEKRPSLSEVPKDYNFVRFTNCKYDLRKFQIDFDLQPINYLVKEYVSKKEIMEVFYSYIPVKKYAEPKQYAKEIEDEFREKKYGVLDIFHVILRFKYYNSFMWNNGRYGLSVWYENGNVAYKNLLLLIEKRNKDDISKMLMKLLPLISDLNKIVISYIY